MVAHQAPLSLGFSRQEHWSELPLPSPMHDSEKWKWNCSIVSDSVTPWTAAYQAPPPMGFSRQEYWSGWHGRYRYLIVKDWMFLPEAQEWGNRICSHHLPSILFWIFWLVLKGKKKKLNAVISGEKGNCLYSQDKLIFCAVNSKKSKKTENYSISEVSLTRSRYTRPIHTNQLYFYTRATKNKKWN